MNQVIQLGPVVALLAALLSGCASEPSSKPALQSELDKADETPPKATLEDERVEAPASTLAVDPYAYYAVCGGQLRSLSEVLGPITRSMVSQKIPYSQDAVNEWRDCSGNFLRLSSYLAEECPELESSLVATKGITDFKAGANNIVANARAARRTTRGIARWYSEQGRFTPIYYDGPADDKAILKKYRDLIRPGTVLWFSRSKPTSDSGLKDLFNYQINHMGTVVDVTRNGRGEVVRYKMYHGRSKGKLATVTFNHYWDWPKEFLGSGRLYPPLGYWDQYLVAIGTIAPVQAF